MARQRQLGVKAILKCPHCGSEVEATFPAGSGIRPGQTIWNPHIPEICSPDLSGLSIDEEEGEVET